MKKFIFGILGLLAFLFILSDMHFDPEKELLKHLEKRYKKEFVVLSSKAIPSREGNLEYDAEIIPVEYLGTDKETDYRAKASIRGRNIKDEYINILVGESANEFYSPKLKELFGENIFSIFRIEGDCEKNTIQEELERRKRIYEKDEEEYPKEKHPLKNPGFKPLRIKLYIFGNEKDIKNKENYREKIYKFIEYLKETNAFEYTSLAINIMDDKSFEKNTYEIILENEINEIKEEMKKLHKDLLLDLKNPAILITYTNPERTERLGTAEEGIEEYVKNREIETIEELKIKKKITKDNFKDLKTILEKLPYSSAEYIFNKYGKVLLSTYIVSPKRVDNLSYSGKGYVNLYERKEDICFEGEEQNYPNGTIKELGEKWSYYITETKNNKKNGTSVQYDTKGNILWEGEYKNNKLDGPFKEYGEYWITEGMYKNNLKVGEELSTKKENGATIKKIYKNGLLEGEEIYYFPNGNINRIYEYKKGKLNGTSKAFTIEGILYEICEWKDDEKNGKYIKCDFNGRIEEFIEYKNGEIHGEYKEFYKEQVLVEINYKDGIRNGIAKKYHYNGNIKEEIMYDKGNELWKKIYSEEGKLKIYNIYDKKHSEIKIRKVYNKDEKLVKEVEYAKDGIEIVKEYGENGSLISTRYFKDGVEQKNQEE